MCCNTKLIYRFLIFCLIPSTVWSEPFQLDDQNDSTKGHKRVLILYSFNYKQTAQQQIIAGLESVRKIAQLRAENYVHEFLDLSPPKNQKYRLILQQLLLEKYAGQRFDLIITVFNSALDFLLNEGKELSPESPCLALYGQQRLNLRRGGKKVAQSPLYFDIRGTLELALKLFPMTDKVLFVAGKGKLDRIYEDKAQVDFRPWQGKIAFKYTSNRSVDEILEQSARLSPGTIIIYSGISIDITGKTYSTLEVVRLLAESSSVPVFCLATSQLDTGVVGGSMVDVESLSIMLGRTLFQFNSKNPLSIKPASHFTRPMVNWRQVQRWNINTSLLPADTRIINHPPTLWTQYKKMVITVILAFTCLLFFTIALTIENRHRKYAETAALESEAQYRALIDQAPDAIVVYDVDQNRFMDANPKAEKLFGYNREELRKSEMKQFSPPEHFNQPNMLRSDSEHVTRVLQGETLQFEQLIYGADGSKNICEVRLARLPSEKYRLIRASYIDITERKQAEKEREELQVQLYQAKKIESVGRLAGGIAHDFNNMLGVILGHLEMIMEEMDPAQPIFAELVEIQNAAKKSADLTSQLLAFARKQTLSPEVLNLNHTVDGMLKMLQRLIGENIDLIWIPGTRLWPVKVDPSQIDQILANLCVNARDAVNGIGKITIETTNAAFDAEYCHKHLDYAPGNYVMLAVSDNGCGMDKETQNKIFEPFYTSKELGQGTGLGLSTVYGIVKQNNGFIYIYSEPNQGTTFKIYLPVHAAKAESLQTEELLQTEEPPQTALLSHETILLVEDETAILSMTSKMLRREGYTVLIASTPSEAIQIAARQNHEIHLLMTDVIMPNMNCLDLVRNISSFYPNIKCLFMSGYTANVITHHGILNDGVNFIQKPFSKKSMVTKVRQILDQKAFNKFLFT